MLDVALSVAPKAMEGAQEGEGAALCLHDRGLGGEEARVSGAEGGVDEVDDDEEAGDGGDVGKEPDGGVHVGAHLRLPARALG